MTRDRRWAPLAALAIGLLAAAPASPWRNDLVAEGKQGAVVSADAHASRIGLAVLRKGGNAIDAAVATFLALAVTHPQAGNLGGGGFMIVRLADGTAKALDFREEAPAAATRDMYVRADGSVDPQASLLGATAAGVPGSPAGILRAHAEWGSMPLADLAAPAIELARSGFEIDHFLADTIATERKKLARFPSSRAVFFHEDHPLRAGEKLVQTDLADTLELLAKQGREGFYAGRTAERIEAEMKRDGGYINAKDLAAYQAVIREPLRGAYRGYEVLAMPPPSSGGVALLEMLNILEPWKLHDLGFGSSTTLHLMVEAMKRAYADRARWLGDPDFYSVPVDGLTSKDYARELRRGISMDRATDVQPGRPPGAKEGTDTTHFSIVDAAGNAVSCTTTINSWFGSGLVVDGTGVLLNNEMDDFSAKPGVPNQFGLVGGEANAIAPGKRPLSSMTPIVVAKDGKLRFVLGSPGGGRIINTVLQVLLDVVDHDMSLPEAVAAPRIHHQWKPDLIYHEHWIVPRDVREAMEAMGHHFANGDSVIGRCQAIAVLDDGTRVGAADPRSAGTAVAY